VKTGLALGAVAALALVAVGCGSGGGQACPSRGSTQPVEAKTPVGTRYLTGVTVTSTTCFDRVEFTFEKGVPGYRIGYTDAKAAQTEDASGRHIAVAGDAFLVAHLSDAATARSDGSTFTPTYTGPRRVPGPGSRVREVVKTGDFEAVVTWAIGLDAKHPFTVSTHGASLTVEIG
jgi:hypothetical protein